MTHILLSQLKLLKAAQIAVAYLQQLIMMSTHGSLTHLHFLIKEFTPMLKPRKSRKKFFLFAFLIFTLHNQQNLGASPMQTVKTILKIVSHKNLF